MHLVGGSFTTKQNKFITEIDDGVMFNGEVVSLVVATAVIRQLASTHCSMQLRRLKAGSYQTPLHDAQRSSTLDLC